MASYNTKLLIKAITAIKLGANGRQYRKVVLCITISQG